MIERPIIFSPESVRAILAGKKTQTRRVIKPQPHMRDNNYGDIEESEKYPGEWSQWKNGEQLPWFTCPRGQVGDHLWVKEQHCIECEVEGNSPPWNDGRPIRWRGREEEELSRTWTQAHYRSTDPTPDLDCVNPRHEDHGGPCPSPWRSPLFMPSWASRINLEITNVSVEGLQSISGSDAIAEGVTIPRCGCEVCAHSSAMCPADQSAAIMAYAAMWDRINAKRQGGIFAWAKNPWVFATAFKLVKK